MNENVIHVDICRDTPAPLGALLSITNTNIHVTLDPSRNQAYATLPDGLRLIFNLLDDGSYKYVGFTTAGIAE